MEPEAALEIINAIESAQMNYPIHESDRKEPSKLQSPDRQWDRIVRKVCTGCGNRLGKYENTNNLAFCYECCAILFPESIPERGSFRGKFSQRKV